MFSYTLTMKINNSLVLIKIKYFNLPFVLANVCVVQSLYRINFLCFLHENILDHFKTGWLLLSLWWQLVRIPHAQIHRRPGTVLRISLKDNFVLFHVWYAMSLCVMDGLLLKEHRTLVRFCIWLGACDSCTKCFLHMLSKSFLSQAYIKTEVFLFSLLCSRIHLCCLDWFSLWSRFLL